MKNLIIFISLLLITSCASNWVKGNSFYVVRSPQEITRCYPGAVASNDGSRFISIEPFQTIEKCEESQIYKDWIEGDEKERIAKIDNFLKENTKFKKYRKAAIEKLIQIGMPEQLMYLSIGVPRRKNSTTTVSGTSIQHIYSDTTYVYTNNGLITAWQNE